MMMIDITADCVCFRWIIKLKTVIWRNRVELCVKQLFLLVKCASYSLPLFSLPGAGGTDRNINTQMEDVAMSISG